MLNPDLVFILSQGKMQNESDEQFICRIRTIVSRGILTPDEIDSSITTIGGGIDINVPVVVQDPIVTQNSINDMIQKHNAEIQKMKAINQKIIEGIVAIIASGAIAATGGGAAALLPLATSLIIFLQNNYQKNGTQ